MAQAAAHQRSMGLYEKFEVRRRDGRDRPGGDRHGARYVVLDVVHDPHAPAALKAYAGSLEGEYPLVAADLLRIVEERGA